MGTFAGKRILITGASRGVGFEGAKRFLAQGAKVIGTARNQANLDKATAELKKMGDFTPLLADLDDPKAPRAIADFVAKAWTGLDILVNNAAVQTYKPGWNEEGVGLFEKELRVNVLAPHELTFFLQPLLAKGDRARVINVSSGAGLLHVLQESKDMPTYRLTKFTLNGLTILWANNLKGVASVNCLDPGWLKTDLGGPNAPGEPGDGGERMLEVAGLPWEVTGKFFHGDKELPF
jgi:NAD(P)-dependent dehydrogenase (short-subunit alcohol dehydrogenase family)